MSDSARFPGERVLAAQDGEQVALRCSACGVSVAFPSEPTTIFLGSMEAFIGEHAACELSLDLDRVRQHLGRA